MISTKIAPRKIASSESSDTCLYPLTARMVYALFNGCLSFWVLKKKDYCLKQLG